MYAPVSARKKCISLNRESDTLNSPDRNSPDSMWYWLYRRCSFLCSVPQNVVFRLAQQDRARFIEVQSLLWLFMPICCSQGAWEGAGALQFRAWRLFRLL